MPDPNTLLNERCMKSSVCKWLKAGGKCGSKTNLKGKPADINEVYECPRGSVIDGKFIPRKAAA